MKEITEGSEKKFLLPGGQRFYFKVEDLVSTINKYKDVSDNDSKSVTIEYGVHSVDSLSGSTGQERGVNGMYFAENRLTKLNDISKSLDEMQSTGLICFDTFALGQGLSGAEDNVPHNIYNAGFKITIGEKLICLKSFVVKDEDDNYSLGLHYVGGDDDDNNWEKNVSDSEFAFPIYWDKDEKDRKISQDDLSKAKANLQIINGKDLNEKISAAKINESQANLRYSEQDDKDNNLFLFATSDKYLYKAENIPTDKGNNKKSRPTSWLGFVGKFVPIPVLAFFLAFFVTKAVIVAIIYAVLSTIAELLIYYIFFHKNHEENNKDVLKEIKTTFEKETEQKESTKDKLRKCKDYRQRITELPWKYGTVKFNDYVDQANGYKGSNIMIFRYKQDGVKNNQIVCIQYCIYSSDSVSVSENKLGTCRVHAEEFPDSEITIGLNVAEGLHLKVNNTLTFCNEEGNQVNESALEQLKATINLDDQSFKDEMDKAAKNKITNCLIKN